MVWGVQCVGPALSSSWLVSWVQPRPGLSAVSLAASWILSVALALRPASTSVILQLPLVSVVVRRSAGADPDSFSSPSISCTSVSWSRDYKTFIGPGFLAPACSPLQPPGAAPRRQLLGAAA